MPVCHTMQPLYSFLHKLNKRGNFAYENPAGRAMPLTQAFRPRRGPTFIVDQAASSGMTFTMISSNRSNSV